MQEQRRNGNPRTDEERRRRHQQQYGTSQLPPRGTGQGRGRQLRRGNILGR